MGLKRAYHHLSEEKRVVIMTLAREGFSGAHIARHCGVSEATISREFSRQFPKDIPLEERRRRYESSAAQTRYRVKRKGSRPKGKLFPCVIEKTEKLLRRGYSPEQIANTALKSQASTVSIYRWLYAGFLAYGDRSLLRHKGKRRVQRKEGKAKKYTAGKSIHTRPASIESRCEFGHFEVDTVESGRNGTGCVFTIVERKTRMLFAFRSESCTAENFYNTLKKFVKTLPQGTIKSLTGDRGKEFAWYQKIESGLHIPFYFADPHSPWQKGSNENTNGLLREMFPKKTNFSTVSPRDLYWKGAYRINNRPRKVLGWKTARECFAEELQARPEDPAPGMTSHTP